MSEIRDRVKEKIAVGLHSLERSLIKVVHETSPINCPWEELSEDDKETYKFKASLILSIKELAIADREAKVPQREKLPDGYLLLTAKDKNDIYLNGQLFAQEKMLKEGWVKEIKDD